MKEFLFKKSVWISVIVRFVLFAWHFDQILSNRKEIISPITNFNRGIEKMKMKKMK